MTSANILKLSKLLIILTWIAEIVLNIWGFSELHATNSPDWLQFTKMVVVVAILVMTVIVGVGYLFYFRARKRERGKA